MTFNAEDIDQIKARCAAVTPGPWFASFSIHCDPSICTDPRRPAFTLVATPSTSPDDYGKANAEFIAHARTDIPNLLSAVAALTAERDQLRAQVEAVEALVDVHAKWYAPIAPTIAWGALRAALGGDGQ